MGEGATGNAPWVRLVVALSRSRYFAGQAGRVEEPEIFAFLGCSQVDHKMIAELEKFDPRGRPFEEEKVTQLMTVLIQQFEETHYPLGHARPVEALGALMQDRNLRQRDLVPVLGASSVISDILKGKRSISKTYARKLAEFFHVPMSLFI